MKSPSTPVALLAAGSMLLSSCTTAPERVGEATGARADACSYDYAASTALGAGAGALVGSQVVNRRGNQLAGALVGAVIGGLAANAITSYLERRCRALAAAGAQMRSTRLAYGPVNVSQERTGAVPGQSKPRDSGVQVTATSEGMFPEGSANLTPQGQHDIRVLAAAFQDTDRKILIVGHTDSIGSPDSNLKLSEDRAVTVARLFASAGIAAKQIYYKGAGETQPVDTNQTPEGRANNRRVEVIELQSDEGIIAFDNSADTNPNILTHTAQTHRDTKPQSGPLQQKKLPSHPVQIPLHEAAAFDFGGSPIDATGAPLETFVKAKSTASNPISLISQAIAAEPMDAPLLDNACVSDHFRKLGVIRSLATGEELQSKFGDHEALLYGTTWSATLNNNLISLTNVSILKGSGKVDARPTLFVFAKYKPGNTKPTLTLSGDTRAYTGSEGILYRAFFQETAMQPVRCIDVVFSRAKTGRVVYGEFYYQKHSELYGVAFTPTFTPTQR